MAAFQKGHLKLQDGARVAVVGAGPAGSLFALYVRHFAAQTGITPDITVYQDRDFDERGARGCKGCAGILSVSFLGHLRELGLVLPDHIVQSQIERYAIHSPYTSISFSNPEKDRQIISVYRGAGPRDSNYLPRISFDAWLSAQVRSLGIRTENRRVTAVHFGAGAASLETDHSKAEFDLVVLASGVSGQVAVTGIDYASPPTRVMSQDELYAGVDQVQSHLGNMAHAFLIPDSDIVFGSLVPKGPFITVSVLSSARRSVSVASFLAHDIVRQVLPERYESACGCRPKAVVGCARNYYADRFVAIGDAVVSRLYKDGIGSALQTARQAARTIAEHGFSREDFARHYQPVPRKISKDNTWGTRLFALNQKGKDFRVFSFAQHRLISDEQERRSHSRPFTRAAWGMFTGAYTYRRIAWMCLNPISLARLLPVLVKDSRRNLVQPSSASPRRLFVGRRRVLILGSGFGGAYTLNHLVKRLNRNENVETTLVSNENFFLFSPLLHEVAMGGIETRHIAYPVRRLHWRDRFEFVQADVEKIDLRQGLVRTSVGDFGYDYLVIALGSVTAPPPSGPEKNRITFTLKTLRDAMVMRNHIISVFERAALEKDPAVKNELLTFIVSGGGYTGVQLVTELSDFIERTLMRFYKTISREEIRIVLLEAEPKIMADLHTRLGAYAMRHLLRSGIEPRLRSRVTTVYADGVEINRGEVIPTRTLIWVAGVRSNPRVAEIEVPRDSLGRISVNRFLEVPDFPGVYAVGDCASFVDEASGHPIPPRAHTGVRQAKVAARNVLAEIRGFEKRPYRYSQSGEVVSLGASRAVFRFHGLRLYGFAAKAIWLVAYSSLVTGSYNRLRIINDWVLTRMFGRDTTYLRLDE